VYLLSKPKEVVPSNGRDKIGSLCRRGIRYAGQGSRRSKRHGMFSDFYNPEQIKNVARIPKSHSSMWHRFILRQKGTQNNPSVVHTCALKSNKESHQRQEKRTAQWVCFSMDVIRTGWRDIPTELYPTQSSDMLLTFGTHLFRLAFSSSLLSFLQYSLRAMECPAVITTELPSKSIPHNSELSRTRSGQEWYLWVCSFEGGRSVGLCLLDTVLVRLARLIVILLDLEAIVG
jgi:hypothetical protein